MRSYLGALSLVLVMSGMASAQQEFRSFGPGLSPMMPVAGPERLNPTGQQQNDQDQKHQAYSAAGAVTPALRFRMTVGS